MNFPIGTDRAQKNKTGLGGFEPPTSGLEARRYVRAKPQAQLTPLTFVFRDNICFLPENRQKKEVYCFSIRSMILSSRLVMLSSFSSVDWIST